MSKAQFAEPTGTLVKRGKQRFIAGETSWAGARAPSEHVPSGRLAFTRKRGDPDRIVVVEHKPRMWTLYEHVCGCEMPTFGSPCPRCARTIRTLYGPLPDGVTVEKKRVDVVYDVVTTRKTYSEGECPISPPT